MPYIVQKSSECSSEMPWAVIKTTDGEVMGCHGSEQDAIQQQAALYSAEPSAKYESIDFTPPKGVREAAKRGLEVRESKPPSQRGGTAVGVARARDLSNGRKISPETARRMKAYFDRHEVDKKGETWDEQGKGWQAWMLWGGDPGKAWSNKLVRQMNAEDNAKGFVMAQGSPNEIKLYGPIGYPGITAQEVKKQLESADPSQPLVIRIDSEGGSVFDGMSIHDAIAAWPSGSKAIIESAAFSIASFIPMAAETIEITENGYLMLHNPYTGTEGDGEDHRKMADLLEKLQNSMVNAYAERTGQTQDEVRQIMRAETWFTASEAQQAGLVDRVLSTKKASRIIEASRNLPLRVVASLKVNGDPSGDCRVPQENRTMATERVAATAKGIKAKYGKAVSAEFIVKALEEEMSMDDVGEMLVEELMSQVEEMSAKLAAMNEEVSALKAQAEEMAQEEMKAQEMMPKEEEKPAMRARGVAAVRSAPVPVVKDALQQWNDKVFAYTESGMDKASAVRRVNKENPGLRAAMMQQRSIR